MSTSVSAVTGAQSGLAAAAQEAAETKAVTMQEAARGDQQAVRKLAKEQGSQPVPEAQVTPAATPSGAGRGIDLLA
jgi:NADP-dependent 3-hydroxy acid dehydrogenase YdfG